MTSVDQQKIRRTRTGLIAHDGKSEHAFELDFRPELRFINEALKLAEVAPRMLKPLTPV